MISEADVKAAINIQLTLLGWQLDIRKQLRDVYCESPKTTDEKKRLGKLRPDYVLYADKESIQSTVIIEAKKPNKSLAQALEQAKRYAILLETPLIVATDGYRLKTWHMTKNAPLFFNNSEVGELFSSNVAQQFAKNHRYDSLGEGYQLTQGDLVKKFKKANDILKGEGLSAGIDRFSEFANLMFLKLKFESEGYKAGHDWESISTKRGKVLMDGIKSIFSTLRKEHGALFENTKIKNPQRMEQLVDILGSFQLSSVRGDVKGMAFEYFIHSYTRGTNNDLGQYFTPRHIIKMMVHFLKPCPMETIYDPFCGTGGMLVECFRYLNKHGLSDDQKSFLRKKALHGADNSSVARIAMMNMIMFGDGHTNIKQRDSYAQHHTEKGKYDIVITNIPFSQNTDYSEGYPVAPTGTKIGDSIGVQHCIESLKNKPTARGAIIVPIGFLYKNNLRKEREYIAKHFSIDRIVELTPKCFNPYTEQQTAVLMISRTKIKNSTVYYNVVNDGFSQDGFRVPLAGENDIDRTVEEKNGKKIIPDREEYCKYKTLNFHCKKGEFPLSQIAEIRTGNNISMKTNPEFSINGIHPIMMVADLSRTHVDYCLSESAFLLNQETICKKSPYLFPEKSIVIPTSGKASLLNHRAMLGMPAYLTGTLTGIIANRDLHPYCLFYFFLNFNMEQIVYDLGYPGVSASDLARVSIPDYSPSKQKYIIQRIGELVVLNQKMKDKHKDIVSNSSENKSI